MSAKNVLTWAVIKNDLTEFSKAKELQQATLTLANGTVIVYRVVKTNGSRYRLLVNGEKTGPDTEGDSREARQMIRAEEFAREQVTAAEAVPEVIGYALSLDDLMAADAAPVDPMAVVVTASAPFDLADGWTTEPAADTVTRYEEVTAAYATTAPQTDTMTAVLTAYAVQQAVSLGYNPPAVPGDERFGDAPRGIPSRDTGVFNLGELPADDAAFEAALERAEELRVEELSANVTTEEIVIPAPTAGIEVTAVTVPPEVLTPLAEVKKPKKPPVLQTEGWTRKMPGLPTRTVCGRGAVDAETGRGDWWAMIDGKKLLTDGKPTRHKTMTAAKDAVTAYIAANPLPAKA